MHSPLLTTSIDDAPRLASALNKREFLVVGLCAAWCDTCTQFRGAFEALAADRRDCAFVWLDVEDDADLAGDVEVENFPTIAVFHGGRLLHHGVSLPQLGIVARVLSSLTGEEKAVSAEGAVTALPALLALHASGQLNAKTV